MKKKPFRSLKTNKFFKAFGLAIFLIVYLFYLWPTAKGYLGKIFVPVKIPQEFYSINQWLKEQGNGFRVLWLPPYQAASPSWAEDKVIGDFPVFSSFSPSFYTLASPYFKTYLEWLTSPQVKTSLLGKYFSFLSARFLIFHDDLKDAHPTLAELQSQKDLKQILDQGLLKVWENKKWAPRIFALNSLYLVAGGLEAFGNLNEFEQFDPSQIGIVFSDRQTNLDSRLLKLVKGVVLESESTDELLPLLSDPKYFVFPADYLKAHNPSKKWSVAGPTEPLHGPWQTYLEEKGLSKRFQFNYDKNLIFTWATKILPKRFDRKKATPVSLSEFQSISPQITLKKNYAKIEQGSEGLWQIVTSDKIKVFENTGYHLQFNLTASKVKQLHPKIYYFNKEGREVRTDFVFGGQDGDFRKKVSFDFITPPETETLQIQLWVLENSQTASGYFIEQIALYQRLAETQPNSLSIPFQLPKDNIGQDKTDYLVLARVYKNQKGGEIALSIDNQPLPNIETLSGEDSFQWERISKLNLAPASKHNLTITNLQGFNALAAVTILPANYFKEKEAEIQNFLQDKKIIYTFPPDVGEKMINLKEPGQYYLALKLPQTEEPKAYIVNINGQDFTFQSGAGERVALASIYLVAGPNKIRIIGPPQSFASLVSSWVSHSPDLVLTKDESGKIKGNIPAGPPNQNWRQASIDFIPVKGNSPYSLKLKMSAQNANQIHSKVYYYDSSQNEVKADFVFGGIDGEFSGREFSYEILTPPGASFLKIQIWANPPSTGETVFQIESLSLVEAFLDLRAILFWPASLGNLGQLFQTSNSPPQVDFSQTKTGGFRVKVAETDSPFMLLLSESYNPLWRARTSKLVSSSFPLYSMLNGFYFDKSSNEPIILEFVSQKYFTVGAVLTLLALIGGVLLAYKKRKG